MLTDFKLTWWNGIELKNYIKQRLTNVLHLPAVACHSGMLGSAFHQNQARGISGRTGDIFASCTSRGENTWPPTSNTDAVLDQIAPALGGTIAERFR